MRNFSGSGIVYEKHQFRPTSSSKLTMGFYILCTCLVANACFGIGDGVLIVQGSVTDAQDRLLDGCLLELHQGNREPLYSRTVGHSFQEDFVISPAAQDYYFILTCPQVGLSATTQTQRIGGREFSRQPLNLGRITVKAR